MGGGITLRHKLKNIIKNIGHDGLNSSYAINNVIDSKSIANFFLEYLSYSLNSNYAYLLDGKIFNPVDHNESFKYIFEVCNDLDICGDNIATINDIFVELSSKALNERVYFIIRVPSLVEYSAQEILSDAQNNMHKRCKSLFSLVRTITTDKNCSNIKFIFIGQWNSKNIKSRFSDSFDSYPFQENEIFLSDIELNPSTESIDYKFLVKKQYIGRDKKLYNEFLDFTNCEISSSLFLMKEVISTQDINETIDNIRFDYFKYWNSFFHESEIEKFKRILINIDFISKNTIIDSEEYDLFNRMGIFNSFKEGDKINFRIDNHLNKTIIPLLFSDKTNLPIKPVLSNKIMLLHDTLNIENELKSLVKNFIVQNKDFDIDELPLFIKPEGEFKSAFITPKKIKEKATNRYLALFPNNIMEKEIYTTFTFGQLIELFESLLSRVFILNEDSKVKIIGNDNYKTEILNLKKNEVFSIFTTNNKTYLRVLMKSRSGKSKISYLLSTNPIKSYRPVNRRCQKCSSEDLSYIDNEDDKNGLKNILLKIKCNACGDTSINQTSKYLNSSIIKSKLSRLKVEKCIKNLHGISAIRNTLAHNMKLTENDIDTFLRLKKEFYFLFSY